MEQQYIHSRVLKINVGFFLSESPGFHRVVSLDIPQSLKVADDVTVAALQGDLRLTRTSEGILVQGILEATIPDSCHRCLTETEVDFPLDIEELFGTSPQIDSPFLVGEDNILDLAPLVREEVLIGVPHHILCRPDCAGLCPDCGHNLNTGPCDCQNETIDSRWAALSELQSKLSEGDAEI